jgi:hypothetical protein
VGQVVILPAQKPAQKRAHGIEDGRKKKPRKKTEKMDIWALSRSVENGSPGEVLLDVVFWGRLTRRKFRGIAWGDENFINND